MSAKAQPNRTGAPLFQTVLVILGQSTTQPVNNHKNYGRRQDTPYDDQQKFHELSLASVAADATPAGLGRMRSAEMVTDRPNVRGISAYIPFKRAGAMVVLSHKEDAPWTNLAKPKPRRRPAAESVLLLQRPLWFCYCFTRFSRAAALVQRSIQQHWAHLHKAPLKRQPYLLRTAEAYNTTHTTPAKGGCSGASAFGVFAIHPLKSPQTEAHTC
jgi:hypothetical protein